MKLKTYNKKRNFKKTPEPQGRVSKKENNLYVIQKHASKILHYDFRLELNGVLLSWSIPKGPCLDPTVKRLAIHVEDHPVDYGHFEGIIPKGEYGGGIVMLWDEGKWFPLDDKPRAAYQKGHLKFILKAKKLKGEWNLVKLKKDDKTWFLIKSRDKYARSSKEFDITTEEPNSILTQYNLDEIKQNCEAVWSKKKSRKNIKKLVTLDLPISPFPTRVNPELATLVESPPIGTNWLHEIKFDGYRIIAFKNNKRIKLMSRNKKDWTKKFAKIVDELSQLMPSKIVLDGEIVLLDENKKPNFQLLQNSIGLDKPFIYYIFDILYLDKYNLKSLPILDRKNILKQILSDRQYNTLQLNDHFIGSGEQFFKKTCKMGLEGIISKKINSPYIEKRTKDWLKTKCIKRQEFIIGGYSKPKGSRNYFGSLYLGYYDNKGKLNFCGNVGTGFNQASLKRIYQLLKKHVIKKAPFSNKPKNITDATWVNPILVAEVEFTEWTKDGMLRHPSFQGLRDDKKPLKVIREIAELPVKITHPDKILYPGSGITKLDLAHYYESIQEWILPYIINRPLTLLRCPENYKNCFYQKNLTKSTSKILHQVKIIEKDKTKNYIYLNNPEGLITLVQMDVLEIHPWGSTIDTLEYPDIITFDLDPAPEVPWKKVVLAAERIRKHLADFNLVSFVKTTGGKGLHVVIPILPEYQWKEVKIFAQVFVKFMVTHFPNDYIGEMSKSKRKGKIFIDYLRNQRGATAIAAYSTRARPNATISVPLAWEELTNDIHDTIFTMKTLPKRLKSLKKDPWEEFFSIKQSLSLEDLID